MSSRFQTVTQSIFVILYLCLGVSYSENEGKRPEVLLCRLCGHPIVHSHEVAEIKSDLAVNYKNATVLGPRGVLVQTFLNPEGNSFDIITARKANLELFGDAYAKFSWFPGYAWKVASCPRCHAHLGWTFTSTGDEDDYDDDDHLDYENEDPANKYRKPKEYSFAGLILPRLIRESYADSLIITPNMYQS